MRADNTLNGTRGWEFHLVSALRCLEEQVLPDLRDEPNDEVQRFNKVVTNAYLRLHRCAATFAEETVRRGEKS